MTAKSYSTKSELKVLCDSDDKLERSLDIGTHIIWTPKQDPDKVKGIRERQWRDDELLRTDELVKLPDYPQDLLPYRQELRNYPQQEDFPNGTRPTL